MKIQRAAPVNELLAKLIFLLLPTAAASYFLLVKLKEHFALLGDQALQQALYFAAGMGIAALIYSFRIRFVPTYALLILGLYTIYKGLDKYAVGEFDSFFVSQHFKIFAILLSSGWLMGWGFTRLRYWSIIVAAAILAACIVAIANSKIDDVPSLLWSFCPALIYAAYIIFTAEQIYNYKDKSQKFWWFLTRRLVSYLIVCGIFLTALIYWKYPELEALVANFGGKGIQGKAGMLKQHSDGSFSLDSIARLSSSLGRSNDLLFCAHIENYLPGTDVLNPLYLTAFYFTKFDTLTETFERDSTIPYDDLFKPDPSAIPLFSTRTDSSVIHNSLGDKLRKVVDVEIYNKKLSSNVYLAPSVGFFVQPITVEKDFRDEFKSAFRTKSYVSELNNCIFVYNINKPDWRKYQDMRFAVLRSVTDYKGVDPKFMSYYTYMPTDDKYRSISTLARKITDTAKTPVDKMAAIRNYFYSKDENGDWLYKYTDNPGVPDIPNASKLMYFLNQNHKGYCAYYAGATLFMLRSLGIPSRIAVGFLTEDRSDKNKGWYWYYANQAHAWVQVYFPGFGWLDFDTTVGNTDENRHTPQPDGTPPMQPPKAWLAAEGVVEDVDTTKKLMSMSIKHFVFHDKEYNLTSPITLSLDMKVAAVYRDSVAMPLGTVSKGDEGTAVSYAEALKKIEPSPGESPQAILASFPKPVPTDEVYLKRKDQPKPKEKEEIKTPEKKMSTRDILLALLSLAFVLLYTFFRLPQIIYNYLRFRHRNAKDATRKAYWAYRTASFYLHQVGMPRGRLTPMQYATQVVDPQLGTDLTRFMNVYLKQKYAKQSLSPTEERYVMGFLRQFLTTARTKIRPAKRFWAFFNPLRTIGFFMEPGEDEKDV